MPDTAQDDLTGTIGAVPTCIHCGSEEVVRDAWANWNPETGLWELGNVFDESLCEVCGERTEFDWISEEDLRSRRIARLNDALRKGEPGANGMVVVAEGVRALGEEVFAEVRKAVMAFDAFEEDNDPHGEHDFGAVEVQGQKLFFKIDYCNPTLMARSADPANPAVTRRVLTIMLAREY